MKHILTALFTLTALGACTWVDLEPDAQSVAVARTQDIAECESISHVTASVMDGVGFIDRSEKKVKKELATIARNEAARLGGDTVVPASSITDGKQHFSVYRCR